MFVIIETIGIKGITSEHIKLIKWERAIGHRYLRYMLIKAKPKSDISTISSYGIHKTKIIIIQAEKKTAWKVHQGRRAKW